MDQIKFENKSLYKQDVLMVVEDYNSKDGNCKEEIIFE